MATLTGQSIASSYEQLLHVDRDGGGNSTTLVNIKDGDNGTTFALQMATDKIQVNGSATITTDDNTTQLSLISTDDDANVGPALELYRNSASPANSDLLGTVYFFGEDGAGNKEQYARIESVAGVKGSGSEEGVLNFYTNNAGTLTNNRLAITGSETVLNESSGNFDFRVESNGNANMLFVDAGNDRVGIGTDSPDTPLTVRSTATAQIHLLDGSDATNLGLSLGFDDAGNTTSFISSIYNNDANRFDIRMKGNDTSDAKLTVLGSGNVGIGTANPAHKIEAVGNALLNNSSGSSHHLYLGNTSYGINVIASSGDMHLTSNGSNRLTVKNGAGVEIASTLTTVGSVGIGIAPVASQKLHVNVASNVNFTTSANSSSLRLNAVNDAVDATIPLEINSTNTKFLSNVGIGVTPSDYFANYDNLVVGATSGHTGITVVSGDDSYGTIAFADGTSGQAEYEGELQYRHGDNTLSLGVAGNRRMIIDTNSRISLSNNDSGTSNTVFGKLAGAAIDAGGNNNVLIGEDAGNDLTTSDHNIAIGFQAFAKATANLDGNTVLGNYAMGSVVSNDVNNCVVLGYNAVGIGVVEAGASGMTAIGYQALKDVTSGINVGVGFEAGKDISTGTQNTLIGYQAGHDLQQGGRNTAVGHAAFGGALDANGDESFDNTFIGFGSGAGGWVSAVSNKNTAVGAYSMQGAMNGALNNSAFGYNSLGDLTQGDQNTALGTNALAQLTISAGNVAIGFDAGQATIDSNYGVYIGWGAGASGDIANDGQIAIGYKSLYALNSGADNLAIGNQALVSLTNGARNVAIGYGAMLDTSGAGDNVGIGYQVLKDGSTSEQNVAVGNYALGANSASALTGNANTAIGFKSQYIAQGAAHTNTSVGQNTLQALTTGHSNVAIGGASGYSFTTGIENVMVGKDAGGNTVDSGGHTLVGFDAGGNADIVNDGVTAIGHSALAAVTSAQRMTAVGYAALFQEDAGSYQTAVGYQALSQVNNDNGHNTALGQRAGYNLTTGNSCTIVGSGSNAGAADAVNQTVIGQNVTGVDTDNSVTLGNGDVTDVYMAQDSGATVHARHINLIDSADDASGGFLNLKNDRANPADNDEAGRIYMYADDDGGNATEAILMIGRMTDVSNGNEDSDLRIYTYNNGTATQTLTLSSGSISKNSGSFKIDHPLESKKDTHHLVHSFVEAPQADNIYRGRATLSSGSVEINLDTVSGMSEGTFVLLNTDIQCFTSNESDWDAVKGSVSGNTLTISCQNTDSTADVSWLVIGERQDDHMKETNWTDENGKVIVEPEKNN